MQPADPWVVPLALLSAFFFAAGLVLTGRGVRQMPPLRGACISVPTAALLMLAAAPLSVDLGSFDAEGALIFLALGCVFPIGVTLLTFEANRRIGPNLTGALGNVTPLFALLLAALLLGEQPGAAGWAAAAVIVGGVALLALGGPAGRRAVPVAGLLLPLAAALLRGLVAPVVKLGMAAWPDPFAATLLGYLVSAALLLGLGAASGMRPFAVPGRGGAWFIASGACNGAAVLTMYVALAHGPVAVVAPLVACYPVLTLVLSPAVMGRAEPLGWRLGAGVGLTVLGVALLLVVR